MESLQKRNGVIFRLIFVPALIALAITLLRLIGELQHWSPEWFSPATGGMIPSSISWIVGITWLAIPFGGYFAFKLASSGEKAPGLGRWIPIVVLGLMLAYFGPSLARLAHLGFPKFLIVLWPAMAIAGLIQYFAWPALFRVLIAYGFASRIPVVVVMFLAIRGSWGTHYDYVDFGNALSKWSFVGKFFLLAFFPQLIFWIGFTVLVGSLGGLAAMAFSPGRRKKQSAQQR